MDFLRIMKRRSALSEIIYAGLNIGLAVAVLAVVWATSSPLPAFGLILLSKWRVLAVRPRFWFANIQANLVDFIVSISFVIILYGLESVGQHAVIAQVVLTVFYIAWLLVLKPRSQKTALLAQAATALFVGTVALYSVSFAWPATAVVVGMWLIGYVSARHVLAFYKEDHIVFLSLLWGVVLAQIGWVAYHWTIAYSLPFVSIQLPQVAIIVMCLALVVYKVYDSNAKHGSVRSADVTMPIIFSVAVSFILLALFNSVSLSTI